MAEGLFFILLIIQNLLQTFNVTPGSKLKMSIQLTEKNDKICRNE